MYDLAVTIMSSKREGADFNSLMKWSSFIACLVFCQRPFQMWSFSYQPTTRQQHGSVSELQKCLKVRFDKGCNNRQEMYFTADQHVQDLLLQPSCFFKTGDHQPPGTPVLCKKGLSGKKVMALSTRDSPVPQKTPSLMDSSLRDASLCVLSAASQ